MAALPRPSWLYLVLGAASWPVVKVDGRPIEVVDLAPLPAEDAARIATDRLAEAVHELEREVA